MIMFMSAGLPLGAVDVVCDDVFADAALAPR
jgi:hypothetical protein